MLRISFEGEIILPPKGVINALMTNKLKPFEKSIIFSIMLNNLRKALSMIYISTTEIFFMNSILAQLNSKVWMANTKNKVKS